jgi:hypothetical protein
LRQRARRQAMTNRFLVGRMDVFGITQINGGRDGSMRNGAGRERLGLADFAPALHHGVDLLVNLAGVL